jgi:hypothetical protein
VRTSLLALLLGAASQDKPEGVPFEARGRLVCLLEELKESHRLEIDPVHEHLLGFRLEGKVPDGGFRRYTVLRTKLSEALFVDKRFKGRELRLVGRALPSALLEVSKFQWVRDGKLMDVFYWCEICSIKSFDPSLCACCQAPVEFREAPAEEPGK